MKEFNLPEGWKFVSLYDLVDVIGGVSYAPEDITSSGARIIRGGNIQGNLVELRDDDVYLPDTYKNSDNTLYKGDVVLVASTGSVEALGRTATVWEDMENVQIGAFLRILRPKHPKYAALISAWLSSEHYFRYIRLVAKGTSINNISLSHIKGFNIPIPTDDILSSFTAFYNTVARKININRAINQNLEAFAKQLYDYWFVQFDFPNEEGKPYKSSGGAMVKDSRTNRLLPDNWNVKTISEIEGDIITGKTPSTSDEANFGGEIPFITIDDIRKAPFIYTTERTLTEKGANSQSNKFLPEGSLCCSCIGTTGIIGFVGKRGQTNQQINTIVFEDDINKEFMYFSLNLYFQFAKAKTGNILPNMNKEEFSNILVVYPSKDVLQRFHTIASAIFSQINNNVIELNSLTKQRDELLPLLMNGQVSLRNCD